MIQIPTLVDNETFEDLFDMVASKCKDGMRFIEVGSFLGGSICYMGQKLKELNKNVELVAIDTWEFNNIDADHMKLVHRSDHYAEFLHNVRSCEITVKSIVSDSIEAARLFEDNSVDFLFLDGNHIQDYVKRELEVWLPKMKTNSIISGHDYNDRGIYQSVQEVLINDIKTVRANKSYYKILGKGLDE